MLENGLRFSHSPELEFVLESYGVRVKIQASNKRLLSEAEQVAKRALVDRVQIVKAREADHTFGIFGDPDETLHLVLAGEQVSYDTLPDRFFKFFDSILRITVAEHAKDRVFIHAGVVGWKGKAIMIPANSFCGKTTLVAQLVKNGATYYSDEYAILDATGLVHAFPRDLSMRYFAGTVVERAVTVEELGGVVGSTPLPVGLVLLTEYAENAEWKPETLTRGQGMMEVIPHTIPRKYDPEFSLKVLNTAVSDAIIVKSFRGEAAEFAIKLLSFFDSITVD